MIILAVKITCKVAITINTYNWGEGIEKGKRGHNYIPLSHASHKHTTKWDRVSGDKDSSVLIKNRKLLAAPSVLACLQHCACP
jgi:hypothetical protein